MMILFLQYCFRSRKYQRHYRRNGHVTITILQDWVAVMIMQANDMR